MALSEELVTMTLPAKSGALILSATLLVGTARCGSSHPPVDDAGADAGTDCEPSHAVCDILPQCGCPSGERCVVGPEGRRCVTNGTLPHGSECSAEEDCAAGTCWDFVARTCRQYCSADDQCAAGGPGSRCALNVTIGSEQLRICTVDCDPLSGTGCPNGIQCNADSYLGSPCWTDCNAQSTPGTEGAECMEHLPYECAVGTACEGDRCRRYCVVGESCDGAGHCVPRGEDSCIVGTTEFGICM
jgi:hypothetical protein